MITIYLARHATPDWGRTDLMYYLPPGPPLTEQGKSEAQKLGKFLLESKVRRVYSSPLERCLVTSKIVGEICGVPVETIHGLMELQPGESKASVHSRLWPVFEKACKVSSNEGPVALITHGGPIAILLGELGMDKATLKQHLTFDHRNPVPPAGVWRAFRSQHDKPWDLNLMFTPEDIPV